MVGDVPDQDLIGAAVRLPCIARCTVIGKYAAIKVLSRQYSSIRDGRAVRLEVRRQSNRAQAHRRHLLVRPQKDDQQYHVMELPRAPLDAASRARPLPVDEAIPILKGVARAVGAVTQRASRIATKPANIFLTFDEDRTVFPKLLDFGTPAPTQRRWRAGCQRAPTQTGAPMGTPHYMSPDQCRDTVNHLTDVYCSA
jgi:serine/threonine-protein kinase